MLEQLRVVDLTATLDESTVMWPGELPLTAVVTESIEIDGSFGRRVSVGEHTGTHFDAPAHFVADAATVADIPVEQLVVPLCVIDFTNTAANNPDSVLSIDDVSRHESEHGPIPVGSAVFLRTGWDRYRHHAQAYLGQPEALIFPGFGVDAARWLVAQRRIAGLGIDTSSVDPGAAGEFTIHRDVTLPMGVWHVENLVNLVEVPPAGAWVVVGVPKMAGASGFPARVLALVPPSP